MIGTGTVRGSVIGFWRTEMHLSVDPWVWVAAMLMLCVYSFLYKDNPLYKFAEHLMVGTSIGYGLAIFYHRQILAKIYVPLSQDPWGRWYIMLGIAVSVLYLFRFVPKYGWMIRYPMAIGLGIGIGYGIPLIIQARLFEQIRYTMVPIFVSGDVGLTIRNILVIIGVMSCLVYFFFSVKHKGAVGVVSRVGVVFLMIGFGASFGNTVMGRISLLIVKMQFLLADWLGLPITL
jgi:hypothetical protein